jgi:fatty acid desaturase
MTVTAAKPRAISWYRCPLDPKDMKSLHERSDLLGFLQTVGYLGVLVLTGSAAFYSAGHGPWPLTLALLFLHGTCFAFQINAVHELGHGTVFRTKALNVFFVRIFAFLGWVNFEVFNESHARHHRYTLHAPDDLEVVLPIKIIVRDFFLQGFINPKSLYNTLKDTIRIARGNFRGEWENALYPPQDPRRYIPMNWARTVLAGHALIVAVSIYFHLWLIPVLVTLAPFYGSWLNFLCNNTQHIGLQDDVPDFRLCCRTFTMNPVAQFLYWHMNYHTEHHMYAAVPCYRLGRLHRLIKHDLPPCPHGLIATWREIAAIQAIQKTNPDYQYVAPLPGVQDSENKQRHATSPPHLSSI